MNDIATRQVLTDIATRAGEVLLTHFRKLAKGDINTKGGRIRDLVTIADTESEQVILEAIAREFPGTGILSEESGAVAEGADLFIIDPLDGTTNYSQGLQHFGVSIGLKSGGRTVAGVIHIPVLNETFYAALGEGATRNGQPIRVSPRSQPAELFLATGFACVRAGKEVNNLQNFVHIHTRVRELRRLGACTVDMCYTACGIFDGFFEMDLSPWDVCAGGLMVTEAGGMVTDLDGGDDWQQGKSILASNGLVHQWLSHNIPVHWTR